jgi:hypothetical protein
LRAGAGAIASSPVAASAASSSQASWLPVAARAPLCGDAGAAPAEQASPSASGAALSGSGFLSFSSFGRAACASIKLASIIVPSLTSRLRAAICRSTSAISRSPAPVRANSLRNRHSVVSSGVPASSVKPQKRRNEIRSHSASSSAGSESWYHCDSRIALNITSDG